MALIYGSVCSGVEAATVAWEPMGWRPSFLSEIDPFARSVLSHHYPEVPLHGDFTTIESDRYRPIDLLVGGTPCQSFSVAGRRLGLDDPRGNLAIEYCALARRLRPRWVVWENVPGVLSSNGGRDFGAFLGLLGECGYGFAYRVLDASYVRVDGYPRAVPQRRKRVFVVGYLGDWRRAAAVLFEPEGMRLNPPPRRRPAGLHSGRSSDDFREPYTLAIRGRDGKSKLEFRDDGTANAILTANGGRSGIGVGAFAGGGVVRRYTPEECEALQGFPKGYTLVRHAGKMASDNMRYFAMGNSMAVNAMTSIGSRISEAEAHCA